MTASPVTVGLVGPQPPPNGGMALQTRQLARLLDEAGVTVAFLATNAPYRPQWVGRLPGLRALFRLLPYLYRVWALAGRVDVVHLMSNSGWSWQLFSAPVIWLCRWRRTAVLVNYRGGNAGDYLSRSARWVLPTLRRASALVVPSGFLRDVFRPYGVDSAVVPNIIDGELFKPGTGAGDSDCFQLLITRNLEPIYGIDTAIRALALLQKQQDLPRLSLVIAGSGPSLDQLRSLAGELGVADKISFTGRLERDEVLRLYREANVLINPARVDNMPNSVLEAMACGVPVLSTEVGGVPYIVTHEVNGLLVPVDDAEAMAAAMLRLIRDQKLAGSLASAGLEQARNYLWEAVGPQWLELYQRYGGRSA